jgi:hypothetical protein
VRQTDTGRRVAVQQPNGAGASIVDPGAATANTGCKRFMLPYHHPGEDFVRWKLRNHGIAALMRVLLHPLHLD